MTPMNLFARGWFYYHIEWRKNPPTFASPGFAFGLWNFWMAVGLTSHELFSARVLNKNVIARCWGWTLRASFDRNWRRP